MTLYRKNDEIFTVQGNYVLAEHNFGEEDYLTVLNSHDPEGGTHIGDDTTMDVESCCPDVPNPLNINW
jgi:hypothetical protein